MNEPNIPPVGVDATQELLRNIFTGGDIGLPLPAHYRDGDPPRGIPSGDYCEYSGTGDMGMGCPRGCEGAKEHYSNDGHPQCADPQCADPEFDCHDCFVSAEEAAEEAMLGWSGIVDYYREFRDGCTHTHD